jgi:hypothetical protein
MDAQGVTSGELRNGFVRCQFFDLFTFNLLDHVHGTVSYLVCRVFP